MNIMMAAGARPNVQTTQSLVHSVSSPHEIFSVDSGTQYTVQDTSESLTASCMLERERPSLRRNRRDADA